MTDTPGATVAPTPPAKAKAAPPRVEAKHPVSPASVHPLAPSNVADLARILWFGEPGYGKTTMMAHLANVGRCVLIDPEKRYKQSALRRAGVNVDNITVHTDCSYTGLNSLAYRMETKLDEDPNCLVGILWDSLSEARQILLASTVDSGVKVAQSKGMERSEWRAYQEDHGDVTEQFRRVMRRFTAMPIHFGATALAGREETPDGVRIIPNLPPAILRDVRAATDVIMYLKVEEVAGKIERSGLCVPLGLFEAKDTFGLLPRRLVNPTFDRILGYINEDMTAKTDEIQKQALLLRRNAGAQGEQTNAEAE